MKMLQEISPSPIKAKPVARFVRRTMYATATLAVLASVLFLCGRLWLHNALTAALPAIDGTLHTPGVGETVRVTRDAHGVPHIQANTMDDLVFAQAFVTAQDRLWQMDMLRRHAAGELAEVLGSREVEHDRTQRYLQLRETAERALTLLPADERHQLDRYAAGVNAEIGSAGSHLPAEFRVLGYTPAPWSPVDSVLIGLVMAEDLSTTYPEKLNREAVSAKMPADLLADMYPTRTWRDHPPSDGKPDMSAPREMIDIPLDESQALLTAPAHLTDLARARAVLAGTVSALGCSECRAGSNNWAVSGAHTASGKPMVANDMHLSVTVPGIWYTADLESGSFHVSGVSLPGTPFIIVGHNAHVAWAFTNSYADVQDLYVEQVEGDSFRTATGDLRPLHHQHEILHVKHGLDQSFDVLETEHGGALTPILTPLYPHEQRSLALRWSLYDPGTVSLPFFRVNAAATGRELVEAFRTFGIPSQNLVYADDGGHIGYHLLGRIPLRAGADGHSGISPVPAPTGTFEWTGTIPYDELPAVTDPAGGVLATANSRITPDDYAYPVTLDWAPPYRNERIWRSLADRKGLTAADMGQLQSDLYSALDKTFAERVAYAVDHARAPSKRSRAAADLLRAWDGRVTGSAAAANIAEAVRDTLPAMLLEPHLHQAWTLYTPHGRSSMLESLLEHQPARWLPAGYENWSELLTAALDRGLRERHAPSDLSSWTSGKTHVITLRHPVFGDSAPLRLLSGVRTGTDTQPAEGNAFTVHVSAGKHGQSERFVADLGNLEGATMTLPMGESGNLGSAWFMDQWPSWYSGQALPLPFSSTPGQTHTLLLEP